MSWISGHEWEAWIIAAAILAALELTNLNLVLIMLAGGAAVGGIIALLGLPFVLSALAAMVTAIALLTLLRPNIIHRIHAGPSIRTGAAALVGRRAVVLREVSAHAPGRIKIGGEEWAALPYDEDDRFPDGATVDVVQIQGATAYVLPVPSLGTIGLPADPPVAGTGEDSGQQPDRKDEGD